MALERRRTSPRASAGAPYDFIRVPPIAGPRTVLWTPMNIQAPLSSSNRVTTSSPFHPSIRSSNIGRQSSEGPFGERSRPIRYNSSPMQVPSQDSRALDQRAQGTCYGFVVRSALPFSYLRLGGAKEVLRVEEGSNSVPAVGEPLYERLP